jgi:hypothetical protein
MGIPKTNSLSGALAEQYGNASLTAGTSGVDSPSVFARSLRAAAGICVLLAGLAAPLQSVAAQLNASALAGSETVSLVTARSIAMVTASYTGDVSTARSAGTHLGDGFLEAHISEFAPKPAQETGAAPRVTEFGSLGVSNIPPFGLPLPSIEDTDNSPLGGTGATAGMPLMVLVWLFGVGLIGMGTVGRRKQS